MNRWHDDDIPSPVVDGEDMVTAVPDGGVVVVGVPIRWGLAPGTGL